MSDFVVNNYQWIITAGIAFIGLIIGIIKIVKRSGKESVSLQPIINNVNVNVSNPINISSENKKDSDKFPEIKNEKSGATSLNWRGL